MHNTIRVWDQEFEPYILENDIQERVRSIGAQINLEYEGRWPLFIAVLNGAFMFASDLFKQVAIQCEISFVKISSYDGLQSSGELNQLIGLKEDLSGRDLIIVEDIVDSGKTMQGIIHHLRERGPASIKIASLLFKPEALKVPLHLDFVGFRVPDEFLLGYGLDYNGRGRNLRDIYKIVKP